MNAYPLFPGVIMRCLPTPLLLSCIVPLSTSLIPTSSSFLHFVAFPPTLQHLPGPPFPTPPHENEELSTSMGALSTGAPRIDALRPQATPAPSRTIPRPRPPYVVASAHATLYHSDDEITGDAGLTMASRTRCCRWEINPPCWALDGASAVSLVLFYANTENARALTCNVFPEVRLPGPTALHSYRDVSRLTLVASV
ncbi:hypothetical protein DFH09DRAFT_1354642 [Mycena vulgaris]|nr:hypothetical protein DFH09DRAFT_1354642 [Mycena vulgaris]